MRAMVTWAALVVAVPTAQADTLAGLVHPWHCIEAEAGQGGDHCIGASMEFTAEGRYTMTAPEGCAWARIPTAGVFKATELDDSVALELAAENAGADEPPAARVGVRVAEEGLAEFSFSSFGNIELAIPQRVTCAAGVAP